MKNQKPLPQGTQAPDFTLRIGNGKLDDDAKNFFTLSSKPGKNIVLAFYPADWSDVCSSQIAIYNELIPVFHGYNADLLGISVDGTFCHKAFKEHNNIKLTLLCDFEPKGQIAKIYNAYNATLGLCERALYVIDKNGMIRYSYISPMEVNPGAKEILETLKKIES